MKNLLLGEENVLRNRDLHVKYGEMYIEEEKPYIGEEKPYIREEKIYIDRKTVSNIADIQIRKLFDVFGNKIIFGRGDVMLILDIKEARGSDLLRTMLSIGVIAPVKGCGKGKYRFIKI